MPLDDIAVLHPQAFTVIVVESPALTVARAMSGGGSIGPARAAWRETAQRVLRHVRRHRQAAALVDASELVALGADAAAALQRQIRNLSLSAAEAAVTAAQQAESTSTPMSRMLAQGSADGDDLSSTLHAELLAACVPLPVSPATAPSYDLASEEYQRLLSSLADLRGLHADTLSSAQAWQLRNAESREALEQARVALERAREDVERLRSRETVMQSQTKAAETRAEELRNRLAQCDEAVATLRTRVDAGESQQRQLLDELFRTQEQLEQAQIAASRQRELHQSELTVARDRLSEVQTQLDTAYTQLAAARAERAGLQAQSTTAQVAREAALQRVAEIERRIQQLEAERQRDASAERRQLQQLQQALLTTRNELDQLRTGQQAEEARLLHQAALETAQRALTGQVSSLEQSLRQARAAQAESVRQAGAQSQALQTELRNARQLHERALNDTARQVSALRNERHRAQELAVSATRRLQIHEGSGPGVLMVLDPQAAGACAIGDLRLGSTHGTEAHRHLDAELLQAASPMGPRSRLRVRLVEHLGRVGLALLRGEGETPPLGAWEAHAREGGTEVCLLIPGDRQCRAMWQQLGAEDWRFIVTVTAALEEALSERRDADAAFWCKVARRLYMHLAQLPPRLRYDSVEVFGDESPGAGVVVRIEFRRAIFGLRELGTIALLWRPGTGYSADPGASTVSCLHDAAAAPGAPPLASWPVESSGRWAPALALPVGAGLAPARRRHLWAELPEQDRLFVLALLDAMPAARDRLQDAATTIPPQTATVGQAARDLHRQARRTVLNLQLRRALRAALRR